MTRRVRQLVAFALLLLPIGVAFGVVIAFVVTQAATALGVAQSPWPLVSMAVSLLIFGLGLVTDWPETRRPALLAATLLLPAGVLVHQFIGTPGQPNGNVWVDVYITPGGNTPDLHVTLREDWFYLYCTNCRADSPVLFAFTRLGDDRPGPPVVLMPDPPTPEIASVGRVVLAEPLGGSSDAVLAEAGHVDESSTIVVAADRFITSRASRTRVQFPRVMAARSWTVPLINELTGRQWSSPDAIHVEGRLGSAAGPTDDWSGDYRLDLVHPVPSKSSEYFVEWDQTTDVFQPLASLESPTREAQATRATLIAGGLAGAGAAPFVDVSLRGIAVFARVVGRLREPSRWRRVLTYLGFSTPGPTTPPVVVEVRPASGGGWAVVARGLHESHHRTQREARALGEIVAQDNGLAFELRRRDGTVRYRRKSPRPNP